MEGRASAGKEYRSKLAEFMRIYGNKPGDMFQANPMAPKTIEIPSYLSNMRTSKLKTVDPEAGKKK